MLHCENLGQEDLETRKYWEKNSTISDYSNSENIMDPHPFATYFKSNTEKMECTQQTQMKLARMREVLESGRKKKKDLNRKTEIYFS